MAMASSAEKRSGGAGVADEKAEAATAVVARLGADPSGGLREVIGQMRRLRDAYIAITEIVVPEHPKAGSKYELPRSVRSLGPLPALPVLTAPLAVEAGGGYDGFASHAGFDSAPLVLATGLSHPFIFHVIDSAGGRHKQLAKSGDDLRQDAAMQQVRRISALCPAPVTALRYRRMRG